LLAWRVRLRLHILEQRVQLRRGGEIAMSLGAREQREELLRRELRRLVVEATRAYSKPEQRVGLVEKRIALPVWAAARYDVFLGLADVFADDAPEIDPQRSSRSSEATRRRHRLPAPLGPANSVTFQPARARPNPKRP
jgi:hypothetical protein